MSIEFDAKAFADRHRAAFAREVLEVGQAAARLLEVGLDNQCRLVARPLNAAPDAEWHRVGQVAIRLLADAVSRELGREIGPRKLRRLLEYDALIMRSEHPEKHFGFDE